MELGTKGQLDFLKGYPLLALAVFQFFIIGYLYSDTKSQYEARIKAEQDKVLLLQDAVKDYRNNYLLSDQLNKASKKK